MNTEEPRETNFHTFTQFLGGPLDPKAIVASQPATTSVLSSHIVSFALLTRVENLVDHEKALAEEQLYDGRDWLFDTVSPSLADISLHFLYACVAPFPAAKTLFDASKYPKFVAVRLSLVPLEPAPLRAHDSSAVAGTRGPIPQIK